MLVRFARGITEVVSPSKETCLAFLRHAGLQPFDDKWCGDGKVGEIVRRDDNFVGSFWYPFEKEMWENIHGTK